MTPNLLAKERRMNYLEGEMSKDGGDRERWNFIKGLERWNTRLQIYAFYSALFKITSNLHRIKKVMKVKETSNRQTYLWLSIRLCQTFSNRH